MSVVYLSFGSIAPLHSNNLLVTSPIGELSTKARTYAKDPGVFANTTIASVTEVYNFLAQNNGVDIIMPTDLALVEVNIGNWLYAQAGLGNITSSRPNTLALLQANFSNNITITDIGEMVTNNTVWFPSFVHGTHLVGTDAQEFYLWFSVDYFLDEYPRVSFTVVHPLPIAEMDTLMTLNYQQIATRIALETPDVIENRMHALTNQAAYPYTERKVISFAVMDEINAPNTNTLYWRYVAWGNSTDAEDQLFDQIQNEILAVSQYTRAQWEEKIPDLFNPLEFYGIPSFDRYGLTNKTNGAKGFSPIVDQETVRVLVDKYITPNMTVDHVIKSMQDVPFLYKSLSCAFISKLNNRPGMQKITALYPDYSLIPSSDSDFDMMSTLTTDFIFQMENLLAAAETVTPTSLPPVGISRIVRFNQTYVAKRIGKVKVLILTKYQMLQDGVVSA